MSQNKKNTIIIVKEEKRENFFSSLKKYRNKEKIIANYGNNNIEIIKNLKLAKYKLSNLTLKNCKIIDSSIKYSYIYDNSYLRHAEFENVDFTGTIFENVNLEKAKFQNCKLEYVKFENCILNYKYVLESKPTNPNQAILLIKSLYKNEFQQANFKNADELFLLLKKEERDLYKKIIKSNKNDSSCKYYIALMEELRLNKLKVACLLLLSYLEWCVWGHGIRIRNIFCFMMFVIFVSSFVYMYVLDKSFLAAFFISAKSMIMNNDYTDKFYIADIAMYLESILGLITFALFASSLYRKVGK